MDTLLFLGGMNPTDGPMFKVSIGKDGGNIQPNLKFRWQIFDFNERKFKWEQSAWSFGEYSISQVYNAIKALKVGEQTNEKKPFFIRVELHVEYPFTLHSNPLSLSLSHCGDIVCNVHLNERETCPQDCE